MDDTTKNIVTNLATGALTKVLIAAGAAATAHGLVSGIPVETYGAAAVAIIAAASSFWRDYGKAIVLSQLEVLKAKSLASAAKLNAAGVPSVTTEEIAAQSPTLTAASVVKIAATMAPNIKASVVPKSEA